MNHIRSGPATGASWRRIGGTLAWPYHWQRPARTEEWAWEGFASADIRPHFAEFVGFPWASLIDLTERGETARAQAFLDALGAAPPPMTLVRATVCQHIHAERALPWFRALGITDLFWSHSRIAQPRLSGIRVHAFPLYPVRCLDRRARASATGSSTETRGAGRSRRYLYSFIGAYCPDGYLTAVRQWLFDLPRRDDALVIRRDEWHYEYRVYGEQVGRRDTAPGVAAAREQEGEAFDAVVCDSIFSLCPSGTGPNSIRLWESLGFGAIPVVLADSLRLPGPEADWAEAIVRMPETREAVVSLPRQLEAIARDPARLERMREAGARLWRRYGLQGPEVTLGVLADRDWIYRLIR